ncbi:topoisomerase C-terminal repeat-containing protein [Flavobacterium sp. CGRL2]
MEIILTINSIEINIYIKELIDSIKTLQIETFDKEIINCPNCKTGKIIEKGNQFRCNSSDSESCNFPVIWKKISEKTITSSNVIDLVKNNKTDLIKGFLNKEKKRNLTHA